MREDLPHWERVLRSGPSEPLGGRRLDPAVDTVATARTADLEITGDVARAVARWAARDSLEVRVTGIDPDSRAITWARAHDRGAGTTYRTVSSADLVAAGERYDAVLSNHVLHHLDAPELTGLLEDSALLARGIAVHNDLRRSRLAWLIYWAATLPLARARTFVRFDGLLSIRRSRTPDELAALVPPGWRVRRQRFFRVLAVHRGTD
ncbi:methyltransferase domain-containing protein [Kocuria sp. HSID17582]|nr:methyltransferase domain-containing protein [Kocuria sp. HSID17582]